MLELIFEARHAGAPDSDDFRNTADVLRWRDHPDQLTIPKTQSGIPQVSTALAAPFDEWVARRGTGRCVVMVHGYDFDPMADFPGSQETPYNRVYGPPMVGGQPNKESWWPIVGESATNDIAVGFAWTSEAEPGPAVRAGWSMNYQYAAGDLVRDGSAALAGVLLALADRGLVIDIVAHSLGTRCTTQALLKIGRAHPNRRDIVRRVIFICGSEYVSDVRDLVGERIRYNHDTRRTWRERMTTASFYNFGNRNDLVLSVGAMNAFHPLRYSGTNLTWVAGMQGYSDQNPHWIDFQLNRPNGLAPWQQWFATYDQGDVPIGNSDQRWNHWSAYRHDVNKRVYNRILEDPNDVWSIDKLRAAGAPEGYTFGNYGDGVDTTPPLPQTYDERRDMFAPQTGPGA